MFSDGDSARNALEAAGIRVLKESEVVIQRLNQGAPGQLGKITRAMAETGVNSEILYSDHDHQLIRVVDDVDLARAVAADWARQQLRTDDSAITTNRR